MVEHTAVNRGVVGSSPTWRVLHQNNPSPSSGVWSIGKTLA